MDIAGRGDHDEAIERSWHRPLRVWRRLTATACLGAVVLTAVVPATAGAGRPDAPTWSDEFAGAELDGTRWDHRASGDRHDGILTPDAVAVGDGMLTITTYTEDGDHYSGMISSLGGSTGFEQTYGYFEARMRFNSSPGQWSAFWLQSPTIGDPLGDPQEAGVEMDVVEHRVQCVEAPAPTPPQTCGPASAIADRAQHGLVWDGYGAAQQSAVKLSEPLAGLGNGSWHTWALNWSPNRLAFLYDDREIWSQTGPISRRDQHIILSSEVGAFFAGEVPQDGYGTRLTSTTNMQVDYVRAWETPVSAPLSTSAPVAAGSVDVGAALACSSGTWSGVPAPALTHGWLRDGASIAGATTPAYTVQPGDGGHALSCRVTATNLAGSAGAESNAVAIPAPAVAPAAPLAPPPAPPPLPAPFAFPPLDRSAPLATISGARTQVLGPAVVVRVTCRDEPCRATATSTIRVPRVGRARARTYRPTAALAIRAGTATTVRLRLSASARAAIRRALRSRRRVSARVDVRVSDSAGNARTLSRQIAIRLPPRRPAGR